MQPMTLAAAPIAAPSLALLGFEPMRAAFEYARMKLMNETELPRGDGHAVVIFPGLASDDRAVGPLKALCGRLGYVGLDWGRGFNTGPRGDIDSWLDELAADVDVLTRDYPGRISLVGWSLGGIYAREVAKRLHPRARQVITIGSPFAGNVDQTNVGLIYRWVNGQKPVLEEALARRLATPPQVPTTSIYSRSDGIVAWQACIQAGEERHVENIEVSGSHCGMGWNPDVLRIVADRLRQPEGRWRRHGEKTH